MSKELEELIAELRRLGSPRVRKLSVTNVVMVNADTEYRWQMPKNCKCFTLHVRDGTAIRIATDKGKVASSSPPYFTLKVNTSADEHDLDIQSEDMALYFACAGAGKVVEIIVGVGS